MIEKTPRGATPNTADGALDPIETALANLTRAGFDFTVVDRCPAPLCVPCGREATGRSAQAA